MTGALRGLLALPERTGIDPGAWLAPRQKVREPPVRGGVGGHELALGGGLEAGSAVGQRGAPGRGAPL